MTHDPITPDRERRLDAITWPRLEKRWCECTEAEIEQVLAELNRETAESRARTAAAEIRIAAMQARIDQGEAHIRDGLERLERWANGTRP
ncbi:hypothetical protein D5S18_00315 [Nocardia panacis]|uniref:Uncharacterized protein n=1 Tax=Nocardia panacis TaxID=2340916 RepID=A0A3A4KUR5_9NOCA|nr:hypothetical protein [Nocardia panacis]RJO80233.1 hypothetical protein D5S18_00315 [Nocardia panacis]